MASKKICIPVLCLLFLAFSECREIDVGDWSVEQAGHLAKWSQRHHFSVGDILTFKSNVSFMPPVLQVTKEAYSRCDTSNPLKANVTKVELDRSGKFYFISGVKELCDKGLKLTVTVPSHHHHHHHPSPASSPAPAVTDSSSTTVTAEPAPSPSSAHGLWSGGFTGFVAFGVAGLVGFAFTV